MKKIIRLDSHVTGLEERLREESSRMNAMDLAQEYMSDSLAMEFIERLRNLIFFRFAWKRIQIN